MTSNHNRIHDSEPRVNVHPLAEWINSEGRFTYIEVTH